MDAADVFRLNVRAEMARRQITITKLGEMAGIRQPNMSRILSGTEGVTLDRAERIAKALDQPLAAFLIESYRPQLAEAPAA